MAKKSKRRGVGQMITIRQMRGLGNLKNPKSMMGAIAPPLIGGGVTGLAILATRHFAKPADGNTQAQLFKWAPMVGLGTGVLSSLALYWIGGAPAALASGVSSAMVAGATMVHDYLLRDRVSDFQAVLPASVAGLGVVVPQRIAGANGVRGILMEPAASRDPVQRYGLGSPYGQTVELAGVNARSFGTPGFGAR